MATLLRQYIVPEFELEFGNIQVQTLSDGIVKTDNGIEIRLAKHICAAINKGIIHRSHSSIKNFVVNLLGFEEFDEDGYRHKKKKWVLYALDMRYSRADDEHFILFQWYNHKRVSERNNFCDFYIQTEENGNDRFVYIDRKTDIKVFINDNDTKSYILETSNGKLYGKYLSSSFIGAFIKLMEYHTTGNDINCFNFYLYMDGRFEKYQKTGFVSF